MAVVKEGAVEPLVALCSSSNLQVAEQVSVRIEAT